MTRQTVWERRTDRERNEFMEQAIRMIEELGTEREKADMRRRQVEVKRWHSELTSDKRKRKIRG